MKSFPKPLIYVTKIKLSSVHFLMFRSFGDPKLMSSKLMSLCHATFGDGTISIIYFDLLKDKKVIDTNKLPAVIWRQNGSSF